MEEEKRPYTMDDYREDFGGLLAEEAEENARLNSWQVVEFENPPEAKWVSNSDL